MNDRGAVTVVMAAVTALLIVATMVVATVGQALVAYQRASTAADAAALAAARGTFYGRPLRHAAAMASANGGRLVSCRCPIDRTFARREASTVVEVHVDLVALGRRTVRAAGRAEFRPVDLIEGSGGADAPRLPSTTVR